MESYSDNDSEEYSDATSEQSMESADPNVAPDLDGLLAMAEANDPDGEVRLAAMRRHRTVRFFAAWVYEDVDMSDAEMSATESSVTEDLDGATTPGESTSSRGESPITLGNYSPGPDCIVCRECALVICQVTATPENGLGRDQTYAVCEHLARIGQDTQGSALEMSASVAEDVIEPATFKGYELNALGDPDFPQGTIIDITVPMSEDFQSAAEEI
ncbi:hypothetical protein B0H16DRAFT_1716436 [Mycena metata]|uniref:Uncharacterized protein n=1 Tax=Mycena metata TaxID=1033252 RepID=A0AAD7NNP7_9AGAR|nr:hypothetical protein B0H16DRAFT_1716436 [Mycena metata]